MEAPKYKLTCWQTPMGWQTRVEFPVGIQLSLSEGKEERVNVVKTFSSPYLTEALGQGLELLMAVATEGGGAPKPF